MRVPCLPYSVAKEGAIMAALPRSHDAFFRSLFNDAFSVSRLYCVGTRRRVLILTLCVTNLLIAMLEVGHS
jgi:hypothetical protein